MANCATLITGGITLNCDDINAAIGVDKDLILYNYEDFDRDATLAPGNIEGDDTNGNEGGLSSIIMKSGATTYTFEGTDYSVQPNVTGEVKEDGNMWFLQSILFTSYNKTSLARNVIEDLGFSRVLAVMKDRSTGLLDVFGVDQGLKVSALERAYTGTQTSNFYQITLATPDVAVIRESTVGLLSLDDIVIPV